MLDRLKICLTHKLYWREEVGSYWVLSWEPMERISMFWLERPPITLFQCIIMWLSLSRRCCSWTCPRACMISCTIVFFCYYICIRQNDCWFRFATDNKIRIIIKILTMEYLYQTNELQFSDARMQFESNRICLSLR